MSTRTSGDKGYILRAGFDLLGRQELCKGNTAKGNSQAGPPGDTVNIDGLIFEGFGKQLLEREPPRGFEKSAELQCPGFRSACRRLFAHRRPPSWAQQLLAGWELVASVLEHVSVVSQIHEAEKRNRTQITKGSKRIYPTRGISYPARGIRDANELAISSPIICSVFGSHFMLRPVRAAIVHKWHVFIACR